MAGRGGGEEGRARPCAPLSFLTQHATPPPTTPFTRHPPPYPPPPPAQPDTPPWAVACATFAGFAAFAALPLLAVRLLAGGALLQAAPAALLLPPLALPALAAALALALLEALHAWALPAQYASRERGVTRALAVLLVCAAAAAGAAGVRAQ